MPVISLHIIAQELKYLQITAKMAHRRDPLQQNTSCRTCRMAEGHRKHCTVTERKQSWTKRTLTRHIRMFSALTCPPPREVVVFLEIYTLFVGVHRNNGCLRQGYTDTWIVCFMSVSPDVGTETCKHLLECLLSKLPNFSECSRVNVDVNKYFCVAVTLLVMNRVIGVMLQK